MKLLGSSRSPYVRKVRVMFEEKVSLLKNMFGLGICLPVRIATGDYLFAE
jgi:glutathione S-transferase